MDAKGKGRGEQLRTVRRRSWSELDGYFYVTLGFTYRLASMPGIHTPGKKTTNARRSRIEIALHRGGKVPSERGKRPALPL